MLDAFKRIEKCSFSWYKIYPGHGIRFVRGDTRLFVFSGSKTRCCYKIKRSSRNTKWTGDWRKANKKDISKTTKKRVKRRAVRFQKDYVGMTLEEIRNKKKIKIVEKPKGAEAAQLKFALIFRLFLLLVKNLCYYYVFLH